MFGPGTAKLDAELDGHVAAGLGVAEGEIVVAFGGDGVDPRGRHRRRRDEKKGEKKAAEADVEVQIVMKKHKLFGKIESSWRH